MITSPQTGTVGDVLRDWRQRRRLSQMDLAGEAAISTRHLSFVESGRAAPSRDMLLRLAEPLGMSLRERNRLLLAGGFAPLYPERSLDAPDMAAAKQAVGAVLAAQEPFPALAVDRHWTLVAANGAVSPLLAAVAPELLRPPVNVLRLSLAPDGLAPFILNLPNGADISWSACVTMRGHPAMARSLNSMMSCAHCQPPSPLLLPRTRQPRRSPCRWCCGIPGRANACPSCPPPACSARPWTSRSRN